MSEEMETEQPAEAEESERAQALAETARENALIEMQISGERIAKFARGWLDHTWIAYIFVVLAVATFGFCVVWTIQSGNLNVLIFAALAGILGVMTFRNIGKSNALARELADCSVEYYFMQNAILCVEYRENKAVSARECDYADVTKIKEKTEFISLYVGKQSITLDKLGFVRGDRNALVALLSEKTGKIRTAEEE